MAPRTLTLALVASLALACAPAARQVRAAPAPADPDRWARAACLRGEYPPDLDARAWAQARQLDLAAQRQGTTSTFATARLEDARTAFDVRCAQWRAAAPASSATVTTVALR